MSPRRHVIPWIYCIKRVSWCHRGPVPMEELRYGPLTIVFLLKTIATVYSTTELICPPISELGSVVTLTCIGAGAAHAHAYSTPGGNTAASCDLRDGQCIDFGNFNSAVLNASQSVLTIPHAHKTHAGVWKCVNDADSTTPTTCNVVIASPVPMEELRYGPLTIVLMLTTIATVYSTTELICPQISELGSVVTLTCIGAGAAHAHAYSTPGGNTAASCDLRDGQCIDFGNFKSAVLNASHSVLTIPRALKTHAGVWKCVNDADSTTPPTCNVVIEGPGPMEELRYGPLTTVSMLKTIATVYSTTELICPQISELGSVVTLTCIGAGAAHAHAYSTPGGNTAASCDLRDGQCIDFGNFKSAVLNASHSVLTIPRALKTHAGVWKCVNGTDSTTPPTCNVVIAKGPSCTMTGDRNTSALRVDDVITLTVNINDYFSTELARIALVVGNIHIISISKFVTEMTNETLVTTLQLREDHFGNVTITFDSVDKNQSQTCGRLDQLISAATETGETSPAPCQISDSSDTACTRGDHLAISITFMLTVYMSASEIT
ncbi:uncharacterized protein LOC124255897 isoform X2 [Haliotis rubra]|uniref:uncharacterized protein LOC124255897 isoform X2 n=1 Tax=Haliotis rubra TaxID=36100 RepID=UPI001EE5A6EE|nr:uncharacterized protein LOC124255897 isoform X2 [Haliotis rubra]